MLEAAGDHEGEAVERTFARAARFFPQVDARGPELLDDGAILGQREEFAHALGDLQTDARDIVDLLGRRVHHRVHAAEVVGEDRRDFEADVADAEREDHLRKRPVLARLD